MNTNRFYIYLSSVLVLFSLSACSTWQKLDRTEKGAVIGGGTGALIGGASGSGTGAVVGGAAGAVAGGLIGRELDKDDKKRKK